MKNKKQNSVANRYKESAYGIYHNNAIKTMEIIASSVPAKQKVIVIQQELKIAFQEIAVNTFKISEGLDN